MNYFITNSEMIGTCYHEFYKGKWDGEIFWKEDSLLIHVEEAINSYFSGEGGWHFEDIFYCRYTF